LAGSQEQSNEENFELHVVSYKEFEAFVNATGYVTDAEKYGWSFVQKDVFNFEVVEGANWRKPDGEHTPSSKYLPVTQVSYNANGQTLKCPPTRDIGNSSKVTSVL
jgi:formylglycine-generating enzyme required for sulfatase activity